MALNTIHGADAVRYISVSVGIQPLHGQPRTASAERVDLQELGDLTFLTHRDQEPWPSPCNRAPSRLWATPDALYAAEQL